MESLKFYDLKTKQSFVTDKYEFRTKETKNGTKYFAVADAPSGIKSWRIVSKDFYKDNV